ncbi:MULTISPECIES: hypothetical protein [Kordiimonas]|uniref:hypothetical protein n=1 Tax=Kordiimonas TaxID=288021 RepID=UPI00257C8437|nr:hypothetical protein [Kordiimonas sp. UBA4487]
MNGTARRLSLSYGVLALVLVTTPLPASASTPPDPAVSQSMIHVASRCINTMKAYRQAIAFIDKRLARSPAQVTFELSDGDSITLLNRTYTLMQFEKRVLVEGMQARHHACTLALLG